MFLALAVQGSRCTWLGPALHTLHPFHLSTTYQVQQHTQGISCTLGVLEDLCQGLAYE